MLRAQARTDDADEITHGELARALAVARLSAPDVDESAIFASEEERVANATVLAELLAPLLARHLGPGPHARPVVEAVKPTPSNTELPPESPRSAPAGVPPIADLIDGMLTQERNQPRHRR